MSDSEDDYMSFKVLVDCQDDVRPSLLYSRQEKRKLDLHKKKQEISNKRPKTIAELERETRERGLSTAISTENKGFKLLEKMGFKAGNTLGRSKTAIKEPIDIVLKQGTSGVGRESHLKEVITQQHLQKQKNLRHYESQYKLANRERKTLALIRKDFYKAQKVCEELDYRKNIGVPVQDFFWTKETIKKKRKMERTETTDDTDSSDEDEEFEMHVTEENLVLIIDYLRSKHLYCLYCVITGIDTEDLKENCPGPYRMDHDDLD